MEGTGFTTGTFLLYYLRQTINSVCGRLAAEATEEARTGSRRVISRTVHACTATTEADSAARKQEQKKRDEREPET